MKCVSESQPVTDYTKQEEAQSRDWIVAEGAFTCCGSNCSAFNNLHQAAGYVKELRLKAGDVVLSVTMTPRQGRFPWKLPILQSFFFVCKQLLVQFDHKCQTHPNTYIFLKTVWLWRQMRKKKKKKGQVKKIHLILLFHSQHTQSTHVFPAVRVYSLEPRTLELLTALWFVFSWISVLHVSKASEYS